MSRKNRTRPPFADTSMFSAMLAPLNAHRVESGLALERVVVVAGVPHERVVAGAEERGVVAVAAVDEVVALAAAQHVVAEPAVLGELDAVGLQRRGVRRCRRRPAR